MNGDRDRCRKMLTIDEKRKMIRDREREWRVKIIKTAKLIIIFTTSVMRDGKIEDEERI